MTVRPLQAPASGVLFLKEAFFFLHLDVKKSGNRVEVDACRYDACIMYTFQYIYDNIQYIHKKCININCIKI